MDQISKIQYYNNQYNSMFDDSESEEEIKDSVKDINEQFHIFYRKENPELFDCIIHMMGDYNIPHESDKFLTIEETNKITCIHAAYFKGCITCQSYFVDFHPEDGDFSIIFKYLRNIKTLEDDAFSNCIYNKKINLPKNITTLPKFCFYKNSLEKFNFNGIISIGDDCFFNCKKLENVEISKTVTEIGIHAFITCTGLKNIKILNKNCIIKNEAFANCTNLQTITIPTKEKDRIESIFSANLTNFKNISKNKIDAKITYI